MNVFTDAQQATPEGRNRMLHLMIIYQHANRIEHIVRDDPQGCQCQYIAQHVHWAMHDIGTNTPEDRPWRHVGRKTSSVECSISISISISILVLVLVLVLWYAKYDITKE